MDEHQNARETPSPAARPMRASKPPHRHGGLPPSASSQLDGPPAWYRMKTRPKHLPQSKRDELKHIVEQITARHSVEMIILFGSHARGDWVEDRYEEDHITYEYRSDFDILIITADKGTERNVDHDNALKQALEPKEGGTRVNYIVHTIQHVNQMPAERRYFFMDILKEGYRLYDSGNYTLVRPPKELPPDVMLRHAEEYFEEWMESANRFARGAEFHRQDGGYKIAAFDLHQASERYITCLLLVHTGQGTRPGKTHPHGGGFRPALCRRLSLRHREIEW